MTNNTDHTKLMKLAKLPLTLGVVLVLSGAFQNCGGMKVSSLASKTLPLQQAPVGLNAPQDDGDSNIHETEPRVDATTFSFQVMNKHQLASRFEFVFGTDITRIAPGMGVTATIESILQINPIFFGSMCSNYESTWVKNAVGTVVLDTSLLLECSTATQNNLPLEPPLGATREALVDKICARAVNTIGPVHFAIHKTDSRATPLFLPSLDEEVVARGPPMRSRSFGLYKAFRLFYPTQPDPRVSAPNLLESYRSFFVDPVRPKLAEWQLALYSLCISPYWRLL
jgi:hypothetical protein